MILTRIPCYMCQLSGNPHDFGINSNIDYVAFHVEASSETEDRYNRTGYGTDCTFLKHKGPGDTAKNSCC
jgi:hypothetical protein